LVKIKTRSPGLKIALRKVLAVEESWARGSGTGHGDRAAR
jgi:hypothetical protein